MINELLAYIFDDVDALKRKLFILEGMLCALQDSYKDLKESRKDVKDVSETDFCIVEHKN